MDLAFDDEQELFKRSARKFFETYCDKSVVRDLEARESGFSRELWQGMAELGWMGTILPSEYDGLELSLLELGVLFEEIGRAAMPGPMLSSTMGSLAVLEAGTDGQKQSFLPKIAAGEYVMTAAVEEPAAHYDMKCISVRASLDGDRYRINGTKRFVPYATVADLLLVAARTGGAAGERKGITLFLVDRETPGIRFSPMKTIAHDKQFQVDFDGAVVPSENVLGGRGEACSLLEELQKKTAALQCVEMVGGAQKELEMTSEYIKVRNQFDRPIGSFQSVQHRAADMYTDVLGARLAAYRALWCLSQGMPSDREVSVAKYFTNKACQRVAFSAQHLHAGIGFTLEYDLHFYYRRAKAFELKLGPQALHLRRLGAAL
jgi:alkylation response protein AidB-like acyl-CoA dehydrogenase